MGADVREGDGLCLRPSQQPSDPHHMGTAVRPAKTSPAPWNAFSDVDVFVDAVLAELAVLLQGLQRLIDRVEEPGWRRQEHSGNGKAGASVQRSSVHVRGDPMGGALVSAVPDLLPRP